MLRLGVRLPPGAQEEKQNGERVRRVSSLHSFSALFLFLKRLISVKELFLFSHTVFVSFNSFFYVSIRKSREVYKKSFELNRKIYSFLKKNQTIPAYLKNQLGRASLSIMLNITEDSGRFSKKDRKNFFVTARSSTFECAAIIEFLFAENEISEKEKNNLVSRFEEISKKAICDDQKSWSQHLGETVRKGILCTTFILLYTIMRIYYFFINFLRRCSFPLKIEIKYTPGAKLLISIDSFPPLNF
jgi:four helix bundle protein